MSWTKTELRDIATFNYGKSLPDRLRTSGDFPVYGSGGVAGTHNKHLVKGPGIIVGRKGTVGSVRWEERDFFPIDTVYFVEPKTNEIHKKYLFYLLRSLPLSSMNSDAAVPGLNRENAYSVKTRHPDLPIQERIAEILSAYDDLIENNRRRIALLEQAARLLYREWFVHFRFPGHETAKFVDGLPEGWEKRAIGDHCPLIYGKALRADTRTPGQVDVYGSSGVVGSHNKPLVKANAIIVGRKGNVGSVFWANNDFWPIDTVYYVTPEKSDYFTYFALLNVTFINTDVAVPGLNRDFAQSRTLSIPNDDLLADFNLKASGLMHQIKVLTSANEKLTKARDLLLPRLMDGRIPVKV